MTLNYTHNVNNDVKGVTPAPLDIRLNTMPEQDKLPGAVCGIAAPGMAPVMIRAERTPGAAAVSGIVGRGAGIATPASLPPFSANIPQTNSSLPPGLRRIENCGQYALITECESGEHHFAKRIDCGAEWCPTCGEDDSASHKQRIARWLPKVQQMESLGYWVIELPDRLRMMAAIGHSKAGIKRLTDTIVETLAGARKGRRGRVGGFYRRGLVRWHWFGDKRQGKWNPHANVLVDGGWLENDKLIEIRTALQVATGIPDLIINYHYADEPARMYHHVKYATRATFRNYSWDEHMAEGLFNFRNMRWWGSWKHEPVWTLSENEKATCDYVNKLQGGICPICGQDLKVLHRHDDGKPVYWSQPVDSKWLELWGAEEYEGTGYYVIKSDAWQGTGLSPADVLRLEHLEKTADGVTDQQRLMRYAMEHKETVQIQAYMNWLSRRYLKDDGEEI